MAASSFGARKKKKKEAKNCGERESALGVHIGLQNMEVSYVFIRLPLRHPAVRLRDDALRRIVRHDSQTDRHFYSVDSDNRVSPKIHRSSNIFSQND